jgi:hypothetical protein
MRGLGGAVVRAGVIALVGKHLFRSIVSLMELITVGGYRIDFQPGNRYQSKIVGEKRGDQKGECQKKYFDHFVHLVSSKPFGILNADFLNFVARISFADSHSKGIELE